MKGKGSRCKIEGRIFLTNISDVSFFSITFCLVVDPYVKQAMLSWGVYGASYLLLVLVMCVFIGFAYMSIICLQFYCTEYLLYVRGVVTLPLQF